jgi:general secretion pathway protein C
VVQDCFNRSATPSRSSLRAQLIAGVLAEQPRASIASITDLNTRETRIYGIGDRVLGASVLSIERLRDDKDATGVGFKVAAIVCNGGKKEYIDFEPGDGSAAALPLPRTATAMASPAGPEAAPAVPSPDGVKKVADNRYEVKRKYIDETLSNLNNVATQARIVPSFKNGVANGFKLFSIQPGSLYSAIGVENGDVIQRINGYEINSPDKALEVYQKLRESSHITIEIERNGQIVRKEYNVTGT